MGEADFGFLALERDVEHHVGSSPLRLVLSKAQCGISHFPRHCFVWNEFAGFLFAIMYVFIAINPFAADFIRWVCNSFGPPAAHIVDSGIDFGRRFIDGKRNCEILIFYG